MKDLPTVHDFGCAPKKSKRPPGPAKLAFEYEVENSKAYFRELFALKTKEVPEYIQEDVRKYFKGRPFDLLRMGLLRIVDKNRRVVWFELNEEQRILLDHIEARWYNKLPVRVIILKGRQIGASTFIMGCIACLSFTFDHASSLVFADMKAKSGAHRRKIQFMHRHLPAWLKPKCTCKNPLMYDGLAADKRKRKPGDDEDDDEFDPLPYTVQESEIHIDSAENRANAGISFTYNIANLSEVTHWPKEAQDETLTAILNSITDEWPSFVVEESTGNVIGDVHHSRYYTAKAKELGDYEAFFFSWFDNKDHVRAFESDAHKMDFAENMAEGDRLIMRSYTNRNGTPISLEQMNWYVHRRSSQYLRKGKTHDLFRRENPSREQEAFLDGGGTYFDQERVAQDLARVAKQKLVKLDQLPVRCTRRDSRDDEPLQCSICDLDTDEIHRFARPRLYDSETGDFRVWELPREGETYYVEVDVAEGKNKQKNVAGSADYSVIDVWRATYTPTEFGDCSPRHVQVMQFRSQKTGLEVLGRIALAVSVLYGNSTLGEKALTIVENNNKGLTTIVEMQRHNANLYYHVVYGNVTHEEQRRDAGITTTTGTKGVGSKIRVCSQLRTVYGLGLLQINSIVTAEEFGIFADNGKGGLEAQGGGHDDTVMTAAFFCEALNYSQRNFFPVMLLSEADKGMGDEDEDGVFRSEPIKRPKRKRHAILESDCDPGDLSAYL